MLRGIWGQAGFFVAKCNIIVFVRALTKNCFRVLLFHLCPSSAVIPQRVVYVAAFRASHFDS